MSGGKKNMLPNVKSVLCKIEEKKVFRTHLCTQYVLTSVFFNFILCAFGISKFENRAGGAAQAVRP
jgi:hypothetical protein